jgi:contact-dependent growth inhibition (CDI) system CdiA-like toxin
LKTNHNLLEVHIPSRYALTPIQFKTVTVAGTNTLKNQIQDGLQQAPNVVVDVRGTSISKAQAIEQIKRVEGNIGIVQGRVTILTKEGTVKH